MVFMMHRQIEVYLSMEVILSPEMKVILSGSDFKPRNEIMYVLKKIIYLLLENNRQATFFLTNDTVI